MFCTNCGEKLEEGARFCPNCGARLEDVADQVGRGASPLEETCVAPVAPTTVLPQAAPQATPTTVMPPAPAAPSASGAAPRKEGNGLTVFAAVMVTLAVVAVIALVVVLVKPFGLGSVAQAPAAQQPAEPSEPAEPSKPADPKEPAKPAEPAPSEDSAEEPASKEDAEDEPKDPLDDPDGYVLADSASRIYTADDLAGMDNWHLYLARNEIFARHGREFNNTDLQAYFGSKSWYTPTYSPSDFDAQSTSLLNDVERKNAETMLKVEQDRGSEYL